MKDRTVIEWDKDDLDALGLLKVDVLALSFSPASAARSITSMPGAARRCACKSGGNPAVYDMLCRADGVGVFR